MKKYLIFFLIAVAVVAVGAAVVSYRGGAVLGNKLYLPETAVMGSAANLVSVPIAASNTNSTTTDAALPDGGNVITQGITTDGALYAILNIQAVGGTATSTLTVSQWGSHDDTTYFNLATSTNSVFAYTAATTRTFAFDPGTATTTVSATFDVAGYEYTRFVLLGENVSTDPNDGVQAYITAVVVVENR